MKALVLVVPLALALSACGFHHGGTPEERAVAHADRIGAKIDATEAQQAVLRTAALDLSKQLTAARDEGRDAHDAVAALLQRPQVDAASLQTQTDRIAASLAASGHAVVDAGATVHAALTPAQRAQLVQKMKPGRAARSAFWIARAIGWGPPLSKDELMERAPGKIDDALDAIDATDAQRKQLAPLMAGFVDDAAPLLDRPAVVRDALLAAWASDAPDTAALHALVDVETGKAGDVLRAGAVRFAKGHAILTPEQRAVVAAKAQGGGCDGHDDVRQ